MPGGRMRLAAYVGLAWWSGLGLAWAGCEHPAAIRFKAGASSGVVEGGVPRGGRDCYTIGVRAGQHLSVAQTDTADDNVVFQLYRPTWTIVPVEDSVEVHGTSLKGAGDADDAQTWSGVLPASGTYLIVVGTTRGSGEYRLRIEIR